MEKSKKEKSDSALRSEEQETKRIAERYHVPYIDLASYPVSKDLVQVFPCLLLQEFHLRFLLELLVL